MFYPMVAVNTFTYLPLAVYKYLLGRAGQTMSDKNVERRTRQVQKIVYRAAKYLNNINAKDGVASYLYKRLSFICGSIYRNILLVKRFDIFNEIENDIKQLNPYFYSYVANEPLYKGVLDFKYIIQLRKENLLLVKVVISAYKLIEDIKHVIRR